MNGYFRDPGFDAAFARDGFVVVDLLGGEAVEALSREARRLLPSERSFNDPQGAAYTSYFDLEYRAEASALIRSFVEPALTEVLVGFEPLFATFFWKPGKGPETPIHQHSPYVSDLRGATINCWCPLVDCTRDSGALTIVPRSQRLTRHIQVPMRPAYWQSFTASLQQQYLEAIEVRAGQAVLFDDTMPHGAARNAREQDRLVTLTTMVPEGATPSYVVGDEGGEVAVAYAAEDEYAYSDMFNGRLPAPSERRPLARVDESCEPIDAAEWRHRLRMRGVHPRGSWQRRISRLKKLLVREELW